MSAPLRVLFVCTANICRSAYAEVLARHLLGGSAGEERVRFASAGTHGFVDSRMDPPMAEEARLRGADPDPFRSRRLTMAMVEQADLVVTAEAVHRQFVLDERPELFRRIYTLGQLARTLEAAGPLEPGRGVLPGLRRAFQTATPADDVADPYGRGRPAASVAAAEIEGRLHRILPALAGVPSRLGAPGTMETP